MDTNLAFIYKCLWQLLHYLVSLYELCLWLRLRIIAFFLWSYDLWLTTAEREQNDFHFLQQCKNQLKKIPKHINLIIGPNNTQVNDEFLTRIFSYALYMNINYISYYDTRYTNHINSTKNRLTVLEKLNCPKGWRRKNVDEHHSIWYMCKDESLNGFRHKKNGVKGSCTSTSKTPLTNGHVANSVSPSALETACVEIYEIQPEYNRPLIAQICRDLFSQRHTTKMRNLLEERALLTEHLSQQLSLHLGNLTEPELSIVFSEDICTFGLLPWHIRFTEFHRHPNGQHFDSKTFASILQKYSRCEQRWGK